MLRFNTIAFTTVRAIYFLVFYDSVTMRCCSSNTTKQLLCEEHGGQQSDDYLRRFLMQKDAILQCLEASPVIGQDGRHEEAMSLFFARFLPPGMSIPLLMLFVIVIAASRLIFVIADFRTLLHRRRVSRYSCRDHSGSFS